MTSIKGLQQLDHLTKLQPGQPRQGGETGQQGGAELAVVHADRLQTRQDGKTGGEVGAQSRPAAFQHKLHTSGAECV